MIVLVLIVPPSIQETAGGLTCFCHYVLFFFTTRESAQHFLMSSLPAQNCVGFTPDQHVQH